jgi:predicted RNase H-related nuclease YkuK (DUF458 family)
MQKLENIKNEMKEFRKENRELISNEVDYIKEWLSKYPKNEFCIWVGCDSEKRKGKVAEYAMIICIYRILFKETLVTCEKCNRKFYHVVNIGEKEVYAKCQGEKGCGHENFFFTEDIPTDKWKFTGAGSHNIHKKEFKKIRGEGISSIQNRLWEEVMLSVEVADQLKERGFFKTYPGNDQVLIKDSNGYYIPQNEQIHLFEVHVDFNGKDKFESNKLYSAAVSYVQSAGYKCVAKPDGWAASYAADRLL